MSENLINTKMKEIYYYNPCLETRDAEELDSINETWKIMNMYALQNFANVNTLIKLNSN
ncbi:hypothetical protein IJD44_11310 [bacterium]|nr:hypothetical protein [bacterium]